jgi:hypothetical protein
MDLMLKNKEQNELHIFYLLLHKDFLTKDLAKKFSISERTLKTYIFSLNTDIETLLGVKNSIQTDQAGNIHIHEKQLAWFYQLKLYYLKNSLYFQILKLLSVNYSLTRIEMLDELIVSQSYLLRLVRKINFDLKPLKISIEYVDDSFFFAGNEYMIRLFIYKLLTDSYQKLEWPFTSIDRALLEKQLHLELASQTETKKNLVYFIFAIMKIRLPHQEITTLKQDPAIMDLFSYFSNNIDLVNHFQLNHIPPFDQLEKNPLEKIYFNFFCRIYISDLLPLHAKSALGKELVVSNNYFSNLACQLTNYLSIKLNLEITNSKFPYFIYYLTLFFSYYLSMDSRTAALESFVFNVDKYDNFHTDPLFLNVKTHLRNFIAMNKLDSHIGEYEINEMCNLLSTLFRCASNKKFYIYVQITKSFSNKIQIYNVIQKIYNKDFIELTNEIGLANIIISDSLEDSNTGIPVIFMSSLNNAKDWFKILDSLQSSLSFRLFNQIELGEDAL